MARGRTLTAWKTVQIDLRNAGATVKDEAVVVDGNLVTSRSPADLDAFVHKSLSMMANGVGVHP
jgi:protease I